MQNEVYLNSDGQEFQRTDINRMGVAAALADDIAQASTVRLLPSNPRDRRILPYAPAGQDNSPGTVASAVGGVVVKPFRAYVGALSGANPSDIRSADYNSTSIIALTAQTAGAGTFRVDLVYATLYFDQDGPAEVRYLKDPSTGSMTTPMLPTYKHAYVTISVVAGTASSTPTPAATPADPPGGVVIPLAYVRLANGFSSASTVTNVNIMDVSKTVRSGLRPANGLHSTSGPFFDGTIKSKHFMPAGTIGTFELMVVFDTAVGSLDGGVLDSRFDWRKRYFHVVGQTGVGGTDLAHANATSSALPLTGTASIGSMAHSFSVAAADPTIWSATNGGGTVSFKVNATTGVMYLAVSGSPNLAGVFFLKSSEQVFNT